MESPPRPAPQPVPEFNLEQLTGGKLGSRQLIGKPVIINFWATWCLSCLEEMPELDRFYRAKRDSGVEMIMINVKEPKKVVKEFIDTNGYAFKTLLDETGDVTDSFQVFGLPSTYFVDKAGVIQYRHMGSLTRQIIYRGFDIITGKE